MSQIGTKASFPLPSWVTFWSCCFIESTVCSSTMTCHSANHPIAIALNLAWERYIVMFSPYFVLRISLVAIWWWAKWTIAQLPPEYRSGGNDRTFLGHHYLRLRECLRKTWKRLKEDACLLLVLFSAFQVFVLSSILSTSTPRSCWDVKSAEA